MRILRSAMYELQEVLFVVPVYLLVLLNQY